MENGKWNVQIFQKIAPMAMILATFAPFCYSPLLPPIGEQLNRHAYV